jgi:hypothetical protein
VEAGAAWGPDLFGDGEAAMVSVALGYVAM